ncbi:MAG: hypothetical protein O7G87_21240 [bacterium]|nr:hypothetical protein [bacterium]
MFNANDPTPATEIKHEHTTNSLPGRNTMTRTMTTLRTLCAMTVIAGVALFIGCGTDLTRSSLAPEAPAGMQANAPFILSFSTQDDAQTLPRASKRAKGAKGLKTEQASGQFEPKKQASGQFKPNKKGQLQVSFERYAKKNQVQVKSAIFTVAKGSIDAPVEITMAVTSGTTMDDVSVEFTPEGQVFRPSVVLELVLQGNNLPEVKNAYHAHGGTVDMVKVSYEKEGAKVIVLTIKVPGFSRYSLGGGR